MNKPAVTYAPRPGIAVEAELGALVAVYSFVIKSNQANDQAAGATGTNDSTGIGVFRNW